MRVAVLISGGGSTLANLIERICDGRLRGVRIVQVVSSRPDVRGVEIARGAGLPLAIVQRRDFAALDAFSDALVHAIGQTPTDLVVMAGFLCRWRIPPPWRGRVLNIHPALLPAFGGQGMFGHHIHEAVLRSGATRSGCTVHLADDEYDHGPILAQREVPVLKDDTVETLTARVGQAERELYPEILQTIADRGTAWLDSFIRPVK
ncbi:MAG: phosphoribosylglycinamide formyltransferase [Planctomycetes bacterium]|nr:phosphoribosylglycinamide formyltransferase [Planctomycetota bacterium]